MLAPQPTLGSAAIQIMPSSDAQWSEKQRVSSQSRVSPQSDNWLQASSGQHRHSPVAQMDQNTHPAALKSPSPTPSVQHKAQPYEQNAAAPQSTKTSAGRPLSQGPPSLVQPPPNERRGSSPGLRYAAEELSRELGLSFDPWSPIPNDRKSSQDSLEQKDGTPASSQADAGQTSQKSPVGQQSSAPLFVSPFLSAPNGNAPDAAKDANTAQRPTVDTNLANRRVATLHLGDLDYWMMDEMYIVSDPLLTSLPPPQCNIKLTITTPRQSRCVSLMGWDIANPGRGNASRVPVSIKMIHGSSK